MKISAAQAYCILDTVGSSILTKSGEISVSYLLELPEAYSLDRSDLEERHNELFRAFQYVRTGFIHKQDVFLRRKFKPEYVIEGEGYIQTAERKYFDGREYLHHFCILSFTLSGLQSLEKAYQANPLAYSEKLAKADRDRLAEFLESVESAVSIIRNIRGTQIRPLNVAEVKQHLFRYVNGFHDDEGLRDIQCSDMIRIGQKKGIFFAVCDERYLPDRMKVYVTDSTLQEANSQLYMSMLERIGVHVPCSHVVNQIWKFAGGSYREELAERVKLFGRYREFDKAIKSRYDGLASYEQEIINEENVLCKTHLNVLLLEDDETILNRQTEQVKMIFTNAGFKYYIPSYEGLYNIFIGSIIGRENNLNPDYLFLSDLHSSLCMGINYSTFRSDKEGILFNERLYQTPIRKDVWDADKKRIPARNMIIVASTGGGKSVTSLNIIQQNIEQNYKQIVVEFGKSFYQLSQLYPDRSLHIDYDGSSPLGINPFYTAGKQPDNEKIKTLVNLVLKFWRSKAIMEDTKQVVSLTKIICRYYEDIPDGHCFPDFYRYVQREGKKLYERLNILPEYFDIDSFLHVCSEFMPGGFYENVCKPSPLENDMQNRDFIVFELTKIKKDPFLISVIMTILFDTIENKILSDRSVRGMLIFDEYAESQSIKDTFSGADIHSTVAFCYQKLRKENGAVGTIVQSLAQLPDNEYTKGIIANTQLLYVLPANEIVYDQTVEAFHIKNRSHVNLMKSIRNDFSGVRPYSEIFIRFMDSYATVVRLELSPEKLLAFQTDGEKWNKLQEIYKEAGSMETAIEKYMTKSLDLYRQVNGVIKNSKMVLQVLSMQGEMLELAAKECTRSDVFTGQEAYGEYTNVLNKIMEESVLSFDLIRTIISPSVSMTDGERIKIIVDLDNKLKENRDKMLDERARFNTVNDAIKRIAALKSTAKK